MDSLLVYKTHYPKIRIGSPNDGGYVIIDLPGTYDNFISGGVSNDVNFEIALLQRHPELTCHAFDGTVESLPFIPSFNPGFSQTDGFNPTGNINQTPKIKFIRKNIGNTNTDSLTNLHEYLENYR